MSHFGDLLQEYYVDKYRENIRVRMEKLRAITTKEAALAYVARQKEKIKATFSFPETDTPLNAKVTGKIERPEFTMEKVIIESRPHFPVTMNLYLPKKTGKLPAVVEFCGHTAEGKGNPTYQSVAHSLALKGCVVLLVDPVEEGERKQWLGKSPGLCDTHNTINRQLKVIGENFCSWRICDAKRAIDYLLTRPEVDAARIGLTGNSGGGTMTTLVNACEDRIAAAAPSCYITRWLNNVENELPVDAEQIPPAFAADGGEMADLLLAAAPRPLLILGQHYDFFDIRGTKEVFDEVHRIYELLGFGERVRFFDGPASHAYSIHNRCEAYQFFSDFLGSEPGRNEPELQLFTEAETYCLSDGNTRLHPEYKTAHALIAETAHAIVLTRPRLRDDELKAALKKILRLDRPVLPYHRVLRPYYPEGFDSSFSRYALETEPGILSVLHFRNDNGAYFNLPPVEKAELFVPHLDGAAAVRERQEEPGRKLFAVDYRGIGESTPNGSDQWPEERVFFASYKFDYHYDSIAWLLDESMTGKRVFDVLCAIEFLYGRGVTDLAISCDGIGTIPAVFAAFLTEWKVKLLKPEKTMTFLAHCDDPRAPLPQSMIPAGILKVTDLDDLLSRL